MNEIKTKQLGEVWLASDGEYSVIHETHEEAVELLRKVQKCWWEESPPIRGDAFQEPPGQEHPFHPTCPACGSRHTMIIHGGDFQCLDCFHRWNTKLLDNL